MDDLISRQSAIDALLTELTKRERKNLLHTWSTVEVKYFVVEMLEQLPSAQPEIIRCKDCKYYHEYGYVNGKPKFLPKCTFNSIYANADDFCSRAERRTDDGE